MLEVDGLRTVVHDQLRAAVEHEHAVSADRRGSASPSTSPRSWFRAARRSWVPGLTRLDQATAHHERLHADRRPRAAGELHRAAVQREPLEHLLEAGDQEEPVGVDRDASRGGDRVVHQGNEFGLAAVATPSPMRTSPLATVRAIGAGLLSPRSGLDGIRRARIGERQRARTVLDQADRRPGVRGDD